MDNTNTYILSIQWHKLEITTEVEPYYHLSFVMLHTNQNAECNCSWRYHPDYLGHTEFVSDANGDAYQYFWYSPFGDALVEEHANTASFSSRYLFNAKELDPETGRYYYGARYYDPGLSIWLSVDPLANEFLSWTPYNFDLNNPVNLIDPDGRAPDVFREQADGSYERVSSDGGNQTHTFINQDGTVNTYNVQTGTMVTTRPADLKSKIQAYEAKVQHRRENLISAGKSVGQGLDEGGDAIAGIGYFLAPFTEGATLILSAIGEGMSISGSALTNLVNVYESGWTEENITNLAIDAAAEAIPAAGEQLLKQAKMDKVAKDIIQAEIGKVSLGTEIVIDSNQKEPEDD